MFMLDSGHEVETEKEDREEADRTVEGSETEKDEEKANRPALPSKLL